MYCNKCGQAVPDTSQFCNHCGSAVLATATRDAVLAPVAEEHEIFAIRPTMIFVWMRYVVAAIVVVAVAAVMGILNSRDKVTGQAAFLVIAGAAVISFAIPIYRRIQRMREVYVLTNYKLEMRFGLIAKIVRNIPLGKIQDVTVTSSVWQRMLNLGDIEIDSASEDGKIVLDDIHFPNRYANMILAELRRRN
jgi:uncharacterized membrane protein YdbT with pleckstrin-like domain